MHRDEWNKEDFFILELDSPVNPLDRGHEGLDEVLDFVESLDGWLRPDQRGPLAQAEVLAPARARKAS